MRFKIDRYAFTQGFLLGAAVSALGFAVVEMWFRRVEKGEIPLPETYDEIEGTQRVTTVTREVEVERPTAPKPPMEDLVREYARQDQEHYTPYSDAVRTYEGDRHEVLTKEQLQESILQDELDEEEDTYSEGTTTVKVTRETSEQGERVTERPVADMPKLTPEEILSANSRFEVIDRNQYENEQPYYDKYTATYFLKDHVLAGFDGDLAQVPDRLMWYKAHEAFEISGVHNLFLRDNEGESDFHIGMSEGDFDSEYERWYGERRN